VSRPRVSPERSRRTVDARSGPASKSPLLKCVLAVAAGLSGGAELGCNKQATSEPDPAASTSARALSQAKASAGAVPESHACRGQNECRGKGGCNAHCPR
jgi:hypothetical protein